MFEIELKFPLRNPEPILARIGEWQAVRQPPQQHSDLYFNHPDRDFAETREAFRLRRMGAESRLTYKGPVVDTLAKSRREIEFALAGGPTVAEECRQMLVLLGFRPVREVRKVRVPYALRDAGRDFEIALDTVEGLGSYVEIETLAEEADRIPAREAILALAARLDLREPEPRSYLALLLACEAN